MNNTDRTRLRNLQQRLVGWLVDEAYPQWARAGVDPRGGFVEAIDREGCPLPFPRRIRVQARQIYAFCLAREFGWKGNSENLVRGGLDHLIRAYRRPDGLFRTLVDVNGRPLDERAFLYDQAFVLLSYATAARFLEERSKLEARALELRELIKTFMQTSDLSFLSAVDRPTMRESNPHMHLLEACQAWAEVGEDPGWRGWSELLVDLAVRRLICSSTGAIGEAYTADWAQPQLTERRVEPGHQFEWTWLLLNAHTSLSVHAAARRLFSIGETYGVIRGVAINALLHDLSVSDGAARLWPQAERLKAAVSAGLAFGESDYWSIAHQAAESFLGYFDPKVSGLWFDERDAEGRLMPASATPASTLYHLVSAISVLNQVVINPTAALNCE